MSAADTVPDGRRIVDRDAAQYVADVREWAGAMEHATDPEAYEARLSAAAAVVVVLRAYARLLPVAASTP